MVNESVNNQRRAIEGNVRLPFQPDPSEKNVEYSSIKWFSSSYSLFTIICIVSF